MRRMIALLWVSFFTSVSLLAHPGHGDVEDFTIIHYFKEPQHFVPNILIGLVVLICYAFWGEITEKLHRFFKML